MINFTDLEVEAFRCVSRKNDNVVFGLINSVQNDNVVFVSREKIEDYLRFLTHAGETRFPIFA